MRGKVPCPVCRTKEYDSFLDLARHMVLKDRPAGTFRELCVRERQSHCRKISGLLEEARVMAGLVAVEETNGS